MIEWEQPQHCIVEHALVILNFAFLNILICFILYLGIRH